VGHIHVLAAPSPHLADKPLTCDFLPLAEAMEGREQEPDFVRVFTKA
jgi:hypothetical protein